MNKNKLLLMSMLSMVLTPTEPIVHRSITIVDKERKQCIRERYKAQGLTEYFYGENSLWALNKKSADRKAQKMGWI